MVHFKISILFIGIKFNNNTIQSLSKVLAGDGTVNVIADAQSVLLISGNISI